MDFEWQLDRADALLLYYVFIILATLFAFLSEKYGYIKNGRKHVNKFFWITSFLCLFIPLAFRGYGIDHESYIHFYKQINNIYYEYNGFPEPLFMLLNFLVGNIFNEFQYIYIFSALISLVMFYIALSGRIGKNSLGISIWMLSVAYYFYMYGLVRMFIAVAIIVFAHKYIEENKRSKYIITCFIAGMFHYSALIMIPIYIFSTYKGSEREEFTNKTNVMYAFTAIIITPIVFFFSSYLFGYVFGNLDFFSRYAGYFEPTLNMGTFKNFAWAWPLLFIVLFFGKSIVQRVNHGGILIKMFWFLISLSIISAIFPIFRLTFYLYYIGFYLYSAVSKLYFKPRERPLILYIYCCGLGLLGLIYIHAVFFDSPFIEPYLLPYYFNIPD
ncbi:EpsG family protein [Oceanobacillus bengalensis]|uniref:EpsG family protein n=1 Tax=Oceanobacillus bengalensis TaxID=1435466 RepID=A0A494YSK7_9BACI|nr:EpsG family protein [Oceanobacillus bengalensis]RKQ12960.1 EpsG family protein [Oceanobacillus bengalensis]